jgi:hypothetical protein
MSTILDALSKSEQERKLNKLPTLVDMVAPHEPSRWPVYIGLVLVLFALTLVLLAYSLWRLSENTPQATAKTAQATMIAESTVAHKPPNQGDRRDSISHNKDSMTGPPTDGKRISDSSLRVDVVSYSDDPQLRFALVNGKLMREGEFVTPGHKIEKIHLNSVEFNARGIQLILSPK